MLELWKYTQCLAYATQVHVAYNQIYFKKYIRFILKALGLRKHATTYCCVVRIVVSCKTLARWLSSIPTICGHCYCRGWSYSQACTLVKTLNLAGPSRNSDLKNNKHLLHQTLHNTPSYAHLFETLYHRQISSPVTTKHFTPKEELQFEQQPTSEYTTISLQIFKEIIHSCGAV